MSYGYDLSVPPLATRRFNQTRSPSDILRGELTSLCTSQQIPTSIFSRVECRRWWYSDPADTSWEPSPSFLDRDTAPSRIQQARLASDPNHLWIFCDGSVQDTSCGAAAICFRGPDSHAQTFVVRFSGQHSSTQAELVALRLGCSHALDFGKSKCITFISDCRPALESIRHRNGGKELAVSTRLNMIQLHRDIPNIRIWWVPSHVDFEEHDLVDNAAKRAAAGQDSVDSILVPLCHSSLQNMIRLHYCQSHEARWARYSQGRDLIPHFSPSISWTRDLSCKAVTLTAQFLTGHFITPSYLHRFHLRDSPVCIWCEHAIGDRKHILFECPRFEHARQQMFSNVHHAFPNVSSCDWKCLASIGRSHLAKFLLIVHQAMCGMLKN